MCSVFAFLPELILKIINQFICLFIWRNYVFAIDTTVISSILNDLEKYCQILMQY